MEDSQKCHDFAHSPFSNAFVVGGPAETVVGRVDVIVKVTVPPAVDRRAALPEAGLQNAVRRT
ncbi:hypothetical protein MAR_016668 [Mya arenaria]|uniref:Uncharacterized protein n=1 Tax=Mya arenaria TaxID=6604 RepID=A0ABY7E9K1_MYAAR|nr:hypothetical protein MAR_016668 [Mya arenaria]